MLMMLISALPKNFVSKRILALISKLVARLSGIKRSYFYSAVSEMSPFRMSSISLDDYASKKAFCERRYEA